jgi:DNA-binding IclR family transcriptional regulator
MSETEDRTSLEKGLALLQEVAASPEPLVMSELTRRLGVSRATTYRLCDSLERAGWIQQLDSSASGRSKRVDLGPQALGYSILVTNKYDQEARLGPIMSALSRTVGETVHAGILDGTDVVHIARASPESGPHMALPLGARVPAHVTALGKAIMATLPADAILHRYASDDLPKLTTASIGDRQSLIRELHEVANRGYAIDDGESRSGVRCLAAPVFSSVGTAVLAISVTATPVHLAHERMDAVAAEVCRAARLSTAALGGREPPSWTHPQDGVSA